MPPRGAGGARGQTSRPEVSHWLTPAVPLMPGGFLVWGFFIALFPTKPQGAAAAACGMVFLNQVFF